MFSVAGEVEVACLSPKLVVCNPSRDQGLVRSCTSHRGRRCRATFQRQRTLHALGLFQEEGTIEEARMRFQQSEQVKDQRLLIGRMRSSNSQSSNSGPEIRTWDCKDKSECISLKTCAGSSMQQCRSTVAARILSDDFFRFNKKKVSYHYEFR